MLWHLASLQVLLHNWLLPKGSVGLFSERQLQVGKLWSQHDLQGLSVSLLSHTSNNHMSSHCQSHSWEVFGGTSQARKSHLQLHRSSTWSLFPFQPFCFTSLAIFLPSQPPLPYPGRWIRHPPRSTLQHHKGSPKIVELSICLSQEIVSCPTSL